MAVICDTCQAANRDKAMFCRGCARKLQAFLADGPSMRSRLDALGWRRPDAGRVAQADGVSRSAGSSGRRAAFHPWLAGAMLLATGVVAAMAWNGLSNASPDHPAVSVIARTAIDAAPSAVEDAPIALAEATTPSAPVALPAPPAPPAAPAGSSSPVVPSAPPSRAPPSAGDRTHHGAATLPDRPAARPGAPIRPTSSPSIRPPVEPQADAPVRQRPGWRDPRAGCEHLFFAFAARCTANHCLETPYAGHPHCERVRADAQRDQARRDMTLN